MIARRAVVSGRVQGVGFRFFAERAAREAGVKGWVRNRPDGTVETLVEGEQAAVDGYLDRLRASYPVDRFTYSASAMNMLYADLTEPSDALALARDMARALPAAALWRPRVAAQEAMTRAKTLIGGR